MYNLCSKIAESNGGMDKMIQIRDGGSNESTLRVYFLLGIKLSAYMYQVIKFSQPYQVGW